MDPFPLTPASFSGQARVAPPDAAFNWLRQGWASFVANPGLWLAMAVLLLVVFLGLQIVPLIGTLAANLIMPALTAGMLHAVRRLSDEGSFEIGDLFAGFRQNTGPLIIVGVLYMAGWLIIALIVMILIGGSMAGGIVFGAAGQPAMGAGIASPAWRSTASGTSTASTAARQRPPSGWQATIPKPWSSTLPAAAFTSGPATSTPWRSRSGWGSKKAAAWCVPAWRTTTRAKRLITASSA